VRRFLAIVAAFIACTLAAVPVRAQQLLHQERSLYRNIFVTQDGDERCMLFRWPRPLGRESCRLLHQPQKLIFDYTRMMLGGLYLDPSPKRVLVIGEGGGTIPSALQEMYPDTRIDLVELDKAVDGVARTYFNFRPGPNTHVFIEDGRVYVKRVAAQKPNYDMVLLDAFDADYIPEHMLTKEFLEEVRTDMAPRGIIVANTFSDSALYDHESATYQAVFGPFFNLKLANRIIVGRVGGLSPDDLANARKNAAVLEPAFSPRGTGSNFLLPLLSTNVDWDPKSRILTDQYSPSNLLNALPRTR
jgi:spermidine synthase